MYCDSWAGVWIGWPHLYFLAKWLFAADIRTYIRLMYMMIGHCFRDSALAFLYNLVQNLRKDLATSPQVVLGDVQWRDEADDLVHRSRKK